MNLKNSKRKTCYVQGNLHKIISRFLSRDLEGQEGWPTIFKVLKEKACQPRIFYLAKLPFRTEGEIEISRQAEAKVVHNQ